MLGHVQFWYDLITAIISNTYASNFNVILHSKKLTLRSTKSFQFNHFDGSTSKYFSTIYS